MTGQGIASPRVSSTINSLKELTIILAGLTITNGIAKLLSEPSSAVFSNSNLSKLSFLLLMIICIVRFYHRNMRLVDDCYLSGETSQAARRSIWRDYIVIFATGILFAFGANFIDRPLIFSAIFSFILFIDISWLLSNRPYTTAEDGLVERRWLLNNITFVAIVFFTIMIWVSHAGVVPDLMLEWTLFAEILINSMIDFSINWQFYFPKID